MARGRVLDPTSTRDDDIADAGPDAGVLAGKRIGFRVDRIWRAWDWISEDWAERLRAAGAAVSFWRSTDRSGAEGERQANELAEWLKTIDVAIVGLANCGSCTGWTVRDAISAAATGSAASSRGSRRRRAKAAASRCHWRIRATSSSTAGIDQRTRWANTCSPSSGASWRT